MILFSYFVNDYNVGDSISCPANYLSPAESQKVEIHKTIENIDSFSSLIIGGGGIFIGQKEIEYINGLSENFKKRGKKTIVWGAGLNQHNTFIQNFPPLFNFDLIGVRDFGNPWEYVPCSSCLHPVFKEKKKEPIHDIVIYKHYCESLPIFEFPLMTNEKIHNEKAEDYFLKVIDFLSSGETVITNSFHGIYWSLLLNKKVLIYRPFSNRFFSFPRPLQFCSGTDWIKKIKNSYYLDGYYEECLDINLKFKERVLNLIV